MIESVTLDLLSNFALGPRYSCATLSNVLCHSNAAKRATYTVLESVIFIISKRFGLRCAND